MKTIVRGRTVENRSNRSPISDTRWLVLAWVALVVVALTSVMLSYSNRLGFIENPLLDSRFSLLSRPASGKVAIVEIDARSIAEIDRWPWPRRYHAEVLERLSNANAHLIAFDIDFSKPQGDDDGILVDAAARSNSTVVLAGFRQSADTSNQAVIESIPFPALRQNAFIASAIVAPDIDGQVRRYLAGTWIAGTVRPSLASAIAEASGQNDESFNIDYGIDLDSIPSYSFIDVISGRVPESALSGKRVIIGATAIELGDRYAVPVHGVIPGVAVQALAAESLIAGRALQHADPTIAAILAVLVVAVLGACLMNTRRLILVAVTVPLAIEGLALLAQRDAGTIINIAPALVAWAAASACAAALQAWRHFVLSSQRDATTDLANRIKMTSDIELLGDKPSVVVSARIRGYDSLATAFGADGAAAIVRKTADRLLAASPAYAIYCLSNDTLGLLFGALSEAEVSTWTASVEASFRDGICVDGSVIDMGFHIGAAECTHAKSAVTTIDCAVKASELARRAGQNFCWAPVETTDEDRWTAGLGSALRSAIQQGHIGLVFQPKLSVRENRVCRAEALVRWNDPIRGPIMPETFIHQAENNGSIRELTRFVLRTAIAQQREWERQGLGVAIAVNISVIDLADANFVVEVAAIANEFGAKPSDITLEITETAILGSNDAAIAAASELKARGFRLSIDDYGTGQSTLAYVQKFPVSELKVDKSFVFGMMTDPACRVLVRSTVELAHALGMEAVAEGVEDQPTLDQLAQIGCDFAQGYFIGKPMPAEEFLDRYAAPAGVRTMAA